MFVVETSVVVERSAPDVFEFVADQTNAPRWQGDLAAVERLTSGPIGVGTEHEFVRTLAGRPMRSRNRFTRYEPPGYVEFEIPQGWLTGLASYRVHPQGSGALIESRVALTAHGPMRLLEPLLARAIRHDTARDEAELKRLLEADAVGLGRDA